MSIFLSFPLSYSYFILQQGTNLCFCLTLGTKLLVEDMAFYSVFSISSASSSMGSCLITVTTVFVLDQINSKNDSNISFTSVFSLNS